MPGVPRRLPARRRPRAASTRAAAEQSWDAVAQFASFGFCKAHAAAFAVPTYQSAWLKAHYPAHFLAGILTHDPGHVPAPADAGGRPAARHPDPAARRQPQRTRVRRPRRPATGVLRHPARRCRTSTASATPRSARSCRRGPSGRSATWGTSCGGRPSPGRWSRRSRTPARSTALARRAATTPEPPDAPVRGHDRRRPQREGDQLTLADAAAPAAPVRRTTPTPRWSGPSSRCSAWTPPGTS